MGWDLIAFIVRSSYRKRVFLELSKVQRPSQIAKSLNLRLTHVTRTIRELADKELVTCLNPKDSMGRFYQLTPKGRSLLQDVKKLDKG